MTSLSGGYLTPASRRAIFLCRPCVDRVQAAGRILSRWSGKLDVTVPAAHSSFPRDANCANGQAQPASPCDANTFGIQDLGGRFPVFSLSRARAYFPRSFTLVLIVQMHRERVD